MFDFIHKDKPRFFFENEIYNISISDVKKIIQPVKRPGVIYFNFILCSPLETKMVSF